ncbi:diguanylate cyclase [Elioraea rosea]|uniref:diguanylate cyclase n=1 Tax=Elioraea rosea TaxID=2492390 RepID=UPI001183F024|nr:diguanylate cyclase [Elioraea rosea]
MDDPAILLLLYVVLPLWLAAGFADWLCHRATSIATTAGPKESLIHLLMLAQVGVPVLAALFLEINAGIIAFMLVMFIAHEATSWWDVSYASAHREIKPVEQHVHSFLEVLPLMALLVVVSRHWDQALALFGAGSEAAEFALRWKEEPLPVLYVIFLMSAIVIFELLPYLEELLRGLRARRRGAVAADAK